MFCVRCVFSNYCPWQHWKIVCKNWTQSMVIIFAWKWDEERRNGFPIPATYRNKKATLLKRINCRISVQISVQTDTNFLVLKWLLLTEGSQAAEHNGVRLILIFYVLWLWRRLSYFGVPACHAFCFLATWLQISCSFFANCFKSS